MTKDIYQRTELLLGRKTMDEITRAKVIVFGIGGVGSWCVESLVRSGIEDITIVDCDRVCITNVNRQLMATMDSVGEVKVEAMAARLREINPDCRVKAVQDVYSEENAAGYGLENYDYVIDAIDSLKDKVALILHATSLKGVKFFSSMGAALKVDPTRISVDEFWKVQGCPLAAALRRMFKRSGKYPRRKFKCVYSPEIVNNLGADDVDADDDEPKTGLERKSAKARVNGSICHTTAIFGLTLAGLVIQDLMKKND